MGLASKEQRGRWCRALFAGALNLSMVDPVKTGAIFRVPLRRTRPTVTPNDAADDEFETLFYQSRPLPPQPQPQQQQRVDSTRPVCATVPEEWSVVSCPDEGLASVGLMWFWHCNKAVCLSQDLCCKVFNARSGNKLFLQWQRRHNRARVGTYKLTRHDLLRNNLYNHLGLSPHTVSVWTIDVAAAYRLIDSRATLHGLRPEYRHLWRRTRSSFTHRRVHRRTLIGGPE